MKWTEFNRYMRHTINPQRIAKGLKPASRVEIVKAYWILCDFFKRWNEK